MTENFVRHFIAIVAMLIVAIAFYGGYLAGAAGWWWVGFVSIVVYFIVYQILEA